MKFKIGQKVLLDGEYIYKGPVVITHVREKNEYPYRVLLPNKLTYLCYEHELKEQENLMVTTFQELNVGDEFTDATGVKYRKTNVNIPAGSCTNAMVISHEILSGLHVGINPGQKVNKIVKLEKIGNLKAGSVIRLENGGYGLKLGYQLANCGDYNTLSVSKVLKLTNEPKIDILTYNSDTEFEVVGHINLKWPQ